MSSSGQVNKKAPLCQEGGSAEVCMGQKRLRSAYVSCLLSFNALYCFSEFQELLWEINPTSPLPSLSSP